MGLEAKLETTEAGYPGQRDKILKLIEECRLNFGDYYYPIEHIDIGGSYTSVYLEDFPGEFNSVFFTFHDSETLEEIDIFEDGISEIYSEVSEYY